MSLNPIQTAENLTQRYLSYLRTSSSFSDEEVQKSSDSKLNSTRFVKGPYLEATPPFVSSKSVEELIKEKLLSAEFRKLKTDKLPLERSLWHHQEQAVIKIIQEEKNVVVATGTGSGKTDAFLIPILNHLFRQKENGTLNPGVRALLLYPMNALANDQLKNLREYLKSYPDITFGRYTGDTKERHSEALDHYRDINNQKDPLKNELICREQMKESPPHILLTNYAMLEYLLLRPKDHVFFDGIDNKRTYAKNWKFLVMDEAHTYNGARGIEMAMLIRRLKQRINPTQDKLTCIATSATLGGTKKKENKIEIAKFTNDIFGEPFSKESVIFSKRKQLHSGGNKTWLPKESGFYTKLEDIIATEENKRPDLQRVLNLIREYNLPSSVLKKNNNQDELSSMLFFMLRNNEHLKRLQEELEKRPVLLQDVIETINQDIKIKLNPDQLISLVNLAVKAKNHKDDQPLLPARYHLFIKAVEGCYLRLLPDKQIFLQRRETDRVEDESYQVFEIGSCRQCNSLYLVGELHDTGEKQILSQPGKKYYEDIDNLEFFLLSSDNSYNSEINEDEEIVEERVNGEDGRYKLCGKCGAIDKENIMLLCGCPEKNYFQVYKVNSKEGMVHKCPACAKTNSRRSMISRFILSKNALTTVLATSLFQSISQKSPETAKLLAFSDSRQDAAYFAPYLNRTYKHILARNLILETLKDNRENVLTRKWRIQDLVKPLAKKIERIGILPRESEQTYTDEAYKWILNDFLRIEKRIGLEGLGLLGFSLVQPVDWDPPEELLKSPWNLSRSEIWTLYQVLLDTFRQYNAITFPSGVSPENEYFRQYTYQHFFREKNADAKKKIKSWIPSPGHPNTRKDFLMRLANPLNSNIKEDEIIKALETIWKEITTSDKWDDYFEIRNIRNTGTTFLIEPKKWALVPTIISKSDWYKCKTCKNITLKNLRNICPEFRCNGTLAEFNPLKENKGNHYFYLYQNLFHNEIVAEEHTAQLTSDRASKLQEEFNEGKVNVLSCSTTFELGVDIGELETVFMRNVPPNPANYVQRAGRAGRRTSSTGFSLTFAQRRSHDFSHYKNPNRMISGEIKSPYFELRNEKVILRHINSVALALFWKKYPKTYGSVKSFFFEDKGTKKLRKILENKPQRVLDALNTIVPENLHKDVGVPDWSWTDNLFDRKNGVMKLAAEELYNDIEELEQLKEKAARQELYASARHFKKVIETIKGEDILGFFAKKNIIPKYGFPVDVVPLKVNTHTKAGEDLDLDRDLKIALSEYAPSSEVVAGGKLWTSRYIKKPPKKEWRRYRYAVCQECKRFHKQFSEKEGNLSTCDSCNQEIKGHIRGEFIVPQFGFISDKKDRSPGEAQPQRTFTTRTYYSGNSDELNRLSLNFSGNKITTLSSTNGKLAIVNHAEFKGFQICRSCGYSLKTEEDLPDIHKNAWGRECEGKFLHGKHLGYEFQTDILEIHFAYIKNDEDLKYSLLYVLLEGASEALSIDRSDIDGVLYAAGSLDPETIGTRPSFVLYDDVPGGAGHVHRIANEEANLKAVLRSAYKKVKNCTCGGEEASSSCYGCIRNYKNQFCHDQLNRRLVIDFLTDIGLNL